jgi:predicted small secreted protein
MKKIILVVLVAVLVAVGFAYAAANTVPVTGAGDGSNTIAGYKVTGVHYNLDANDPSIIASVDFMLSRLDTQSNPAETVSIQLLSDGEWYECSIPSGSNNWLCPVGNVSILAPITLRVVAAQ